jgi:hypothetical protein
MVDEQAKKVENPDEEHKMMETKEEDEPTAKNTPRRRFGRQSKPKKKPTLEMEPEVKKTLASTFKKFTPQIRGAKGSKNPEEFVPSGLMSHAEWWVKSASLNVRKMEESF